VRPLFGVRDVREGDFGREIERELVEREVEEVDFGSARATRAKLSRQTMVNRIVSMGPHRLFLAEQRDGRDSNKPNVHESPRKRDSEWVPGCKNKRSGPFLTEFYTTEESGLG
jgi:hypothetical protein